MDLLDKFEQALGLAVIYDGAEQRHEDFFKAAIAYEQAGGTQESVNVLLDTAKQAFARLFNANSAESFWERLERAGAKVFDCGAVLIPPDTHTGGINPALSDSPTPYVRPQYQARLAEVVRALEAQGVYVDDLVLDIGRVYPTQIRTQPYVIVTIPRLNAQIAVSDQEDEALFVAQPAMPVGDWALFRKADLKAEPAKWPDITRIVHAGAWQEKMLKAVFGTLIGVGPKVQLDGYVKAHRSKKYELSDRMIIALAKAVQRAHPKRTPPSAAYNKPIDRHILANVTGDPEFPNLSFSQINERLRCKSSSLAKLLEDSGQFDNDLTDAQIIRLAMAVQLAHPERRKPTPHDKQPIPHGIVVEVTGDPDFPVISFDVIHSRLVRKGTTLSQLLDQSGQFNNQLSHAEIVELAIAMRRLHPKRRRPTGDHDKPIPRDILENVTGNPRFPSISFKAIDARLNKEGTSLAQVLDQSGRVKVELTDDEIIQLALAVQSADPQKRRPTVKDKDNIPRVIVTNITGDPDFADISFQTINARLVLKGSSLGKLLDEAGVPKTLGPKAPQP